MHKRDEREMVGSTMKEMKDRCGSFLIVSQTNAHTDFCIGLAVDSQYYSNSKKETRIPFNN